MKLKTLLLLLFFPVFVYAQNNRLDSLLKVIETSKDDSVKAENLYDIARIYELEKIDLPNAKKYAQMAIDESQRVKYYAGAFRATILLAYSYREMAQKTEAINFLQKAELVFESHKELSSQNSLCGNYINTYCAIADVYSGMRDFSNAEKFALKALELSEKYKTAKGKCWMTLSGIFSEQNNIADAKDYALKALNYFKENNSLVDVARTYAFLARYAYNYKDFLGSIANYQLSFDNYKKVKSIYGMRVALYNLAEVYLKIDSIDKAEYYINEVYKYTTSSSNDVIFLYHINQFKFNINYAKKNYQAALSLCKDMLDYALKDKSNYNIKEVYSKYLLVYKAINDVGNALMTSEKIRELNDSIYNISIAKNSAELVKKYEAEKKEQQISFLDKENRLTKDKLEKESLLADALKNENTLKEEKLQEAILLEQAIARENKLKDGDIKKNAQLNQTLEMQNKIMQKNSSIEARERWLLLLLLLVCIIFGLNYYWIYLRQQANYKKIVRQSEDLQVLNKEVHHRVKNNLQVVVSMLRLQARSESDKTIIDALSVAENRVQTIAMVHRKLYKSESVSNIQLTEYLRELMDLLVAQFESSTQNITYTINDLANLTTNLDTAIPLGLIVNELVTNSFVHAFQSMKDLEVSLLIENNGGKGYKLTLIDNGKGIEGGKLPDNNISLGLRLVSLFAEQLNGKLKYEYDNGAKFVITFFSVAN